MRRFETHHPWMVALVAAIGLTWSLVFVGSALATPLVNGASIETRTFNDCPLSILTVNNNYPASVEISDEMNPACLGFANLHSWSFSEDGGATAAMFNNNSNFRFGADFMISGPGEGEGGLRVSPWYGKFVDGRFMANATTGEIACFGGAIPFYSFTFNHGITYVKGTTIRLEITYRARDLFSTDPASIQYRVIYNGTTYDSPVLPFGEQNPAECNPNGLWGMLNDGRVGGYFQPRANTGAALTGTWSNIEFEDLPPVGTPLANGASIETRTFNDCALSILTVNNNYPASVEISDEMNPACLGFANLHSWSFSEDGGATAAAFHNNSNFRFGADFMISGPGEGEGGLRVSPWYGKFVDGRFMANATTGEIACFGGAIPFYSFSVNHGITYVKGTTIRLEIAYSANELVSTGPATIQYRVIYNGTTYDSPVLPFGEQNPAECNPYSLWGMLNDGRVGGYFQPRANTGAALTGTWGNIAFSDCPVSMQFTFNPHALNLSAHGNFVTGYLEPPAGYAASDIDVGSILLNGSVAVAAGAPTSIGDFDNDMIPDLMVKFNRSEVTAILAVGNDVQMTVSGLVAGDCFSGSDMIRVRDSVLAMPVAGSILVPGTTAEVRWEVEQRYKLVDLLSSFDGGATWNIEARGLPNSGNHFWSVPEVASDQGLLSVVVIGAEGDPGLSLEAELGTSDAFVIADPTDVTNRGFVFALRGVSPNPARLGFSVTFSLPNSEAAQLEVYDVRGRQVASSQVGQMGPGLHSVTFGKGKNFAAGVYLVRLRQGGHSQTTQATVIQ